MTAHLVLPDGHPGRGFLSEIQTQMIQQFSIHHATIQIEIDDEDEDACRTDCGSES